jgi:hypothetical protein
MIDSDARALKTPAVGRLPEIDLLEGVHDLLVTEL